MSAARETRTSDERVNLNRRFLIALTTVPGGALGNMHRIDMSRSRNPKS